MKMSLMRIVYLKIATAYATTSDHKLKRKISKDIFFGCFSTQMVVNRAAAVLLRWANRKTHKSTASFSPDFPQTNEARF